MKRSQILPAYPLVYMEPPRVVGGDPSLRVTMGMTARVAIAAEIMPAVFTAEVHEARDRGLDWPDSTTIARAALNFADALIELNDADLKASIEGRKIV